MARVGKLRPRLVSIKFRWVVVSVFHVSSLSVHIYEQRTLFRILARFWFPVVNKEVTHFIMACAHCQLVNSCSHEAQQLLQKIHSGTTFNVLFLDFWGPWRNPRSGWISQYPHMPGLYERIWSRGSQWIEASYIILGRTMGFWGILCPILASKNYCHGGALFHSARIFR